MQANIFKNTSIELLLKSELIPLWEQLNMGVCVINSEGICVYMNSFQKNLDGFNTISVLGKHMSELYLTHNINELPSLECLREQKALLKKTYWYKTINNKLFNSINDFFPLFRRGRIDGVISFTQVYDIGNISKNSKKETTLEKEEGLLHGKKSNSLEFNKYYFTDIIGENETIKHIISQSMLAAKTSTPVLIWGESGTGKELFAQAIHNASERKNNLLIPINCAAIPENLLEGILFGTSRGSFTDAVDKAGLFEEANGGTIIFDELNSMPIGLQAKLLRVLQEKSIRRIGAREEIPVDVRIISILNEPPHSAIKEGRLRKDFFYRLAVVSLKIPSLRERRDDIPLLVERFTEEIIKKYHLPKTTLSNSVMQAFVEHDWQGNVRELFHVIESSLVLLGSKKILELSDLPSSFFENDNSTVLNSFIKTHETNQEHFRALAQSKTENKDHESIPSYFDYTNVNSKTKISLKSTVEKYEYACIMNVLVKTGGNVAKAARILELTPSSLHYRMKVLDINTEDF